ncbi:universal stress protein [Jeotgalibaca ciconiae]|uniref:Universal stress protein n=1 Tax=Jeotgalibaca ciconiae TaxID=2496265 RepID=A0A3Q9BIY3_9LACT|nr:universal stress protein [Jeotgalibaca ciconiae]AZP03425.1 universal stress protein [Jeotgalibaca ciconiae]HJB23562.1 universal stress protein [Candidatus Jeotgalibaca pullicola]
MSKDYKNILIPVDGSQQSINAFKKAVQIAKRNEAVLHLVTIVDKTNDPDEAASIERDREGLFKSLEAHADKENLSIKKDIKFGSAKKLIAEELVKDWNIDLIVIGATGKGRIAKLVVGSITNHVTRYARCDVLIVK